MLAIGSVCVSLQVIQDWVNFSTEASDLAADHSTERYLTNAVNYYQRLKEKARKCLDSSNGLTLCASQGLVQVEPGHDLRLGQPRHDLPKEEPTVPGEVTFMDTPGVVASYLISLKDAFMQPTTNETCGDAANITVNEVAPSIDYMQAAGCPFAKAFPQPKEDLDEWISVGLKKFEAGWTSSGCPVGPLVRSLTPASGI